MKRIFFLIAVAVLACFSFSCKESITDSRPRIIRAPQDMIWTADTIKGIGTATQLIPDNLLVFAPNDAWLTCWSDIARGLIWHFDGKTWNESNIQADVGGMRINDIAGYSSNDLWTCGYTGDEIFLAHYNGRNWEKYNTTGIKGELLDMCKDADGNIWASGRNGLVMKYDKTKWRSNVIKIPNLDPEQYFNKCIRFVNNEMYISISVKGYNNGNKYYFVGGTIDNWKLLDSMVLVNPNSIIKWGYYQFSVSNNKLYSMGIGGLWNYESGWQRKYNYSSALFDAWEASKDYILTGGDDDIEFFNGSSWNNIKSIFKITTPNYRFRNVWTDGYESMIVGYDVFDLKPRIIVWRGN
ncbi:MAG: hypothetical protein WCZ90_19950 [Melioribacteraceae bacterium]